MRLQNLNDSASTTNVCMFLLLKNAYTSRYYTLPKMLNCVKFKCQTKMLGMWLSDTAHVLHLYSLSFDS